MDTQNPFLELESFPTDIWAYFVWYLPGEQLARLALTGSTLLLRRLKSPKVVTSVKLGNNLLILKSLPTFFNDLPSLEELSINSCQFFWSNNLRLTINSIPSGVRKLELSGEWGFNPQLLFIEQGAASKLRERLPTWMSSPLMFTEQVATLKLHEHLPHLESLDFSDLTFGNYSWMAHCPQSLTRLSLDRWTGGVELPSTLVHFKARSVLLQTHRLVSQLPALESFEAVEVKGVDLLVPLLPASTLKLCLGKDHEYFNPDSQHVRLEQLPKSLTWLRVPQSILFGTPEAISSLPSTLTYLNMGPEIPCSAWHLLPPNLTKLSVTANPPTRPFVSKINGVHREMTSFPFGALPRSLTSFCLTLESASCHAFCPPPAPEEFYQTYFPPQLKSLKIPEIQLSPKTAKLLPSSLILLEIGNFCERVCEHLPRGLTELASDRTMMTPNLIKFLPKSLICLDLSCELDAFSWFDYNTGQRLESISDLEEHSIHKICTSKQFDWNDTSPLPPALQYLYISDTEELADSFLSHQKLPNLAELTLQASKHFTDLSIPSLSSQLQYLALSSSSKISGKSFEFLPRSLTHLDLHSSESIFDPDIQHLPRTLQYADLAHAIHLTDLCVPDLPPHLETLYLKYNSLITPSSFPNFPYRIRSSLQYEPLQLASWSVDMGVVHQEDS